MKQEFKIEWQDRRQDDWQAKSFVTEDVTEARRMYEAVNRFHVAGLTKSIRLFTRAALPWVALESLPAVTE